MSIEHLEPCLDASPEPGDGASHATGCLCGPNYLLIGFNGTSLLSGSIVRKGGQLGARGAQRERHRLVGVRGADIADTEAGMSVGPAQHDILGGQGGTSTGVLWSHPLSGANAMCHVTERSDPRIRGRSTPGDVCGRVKAEGRGGCPGRHQGCVSCLRAGSRGRGGTVVLHLAVPIDLQAVATHDWLVSAGGASARRLTSACPNTPPVLATICVARTRPAASRVPRAARAEAAAHSQLAVRALLALATHTSAGGAKVTTIVWHYERASRKPHAVLLARTHLPCPRRAASLEHGRPRAARASAAYSGNTTSMGVPAPAAQAPSVLHLRPLARGGVRACTRPSCVGGRTCFRTRARSRLTPAPAGCGLATHPMSKHARGGDFSRMGGSAPPPLARLAPASVSRNVAPRSVLGGLRVARRTLSRARRPTCGVAGSMRARHGGMRKADGARRGDGAQAAGAPELRWRTATGLGLGRDLREPRVRELHRDLLEADGAWRAHQRVRLWRTRVRDPPARPAARRALAATWEQQAGRADGTGGGLVGGRSGQSARRGACAIAGTLRVGGADAQGVCGGRSGSRGAARLWEADATRVCGGGGREAAAEGGAGRTRWPRAQLRCGGGRVMRRWEGGRGCVVASEGGGGAASVERAGLRVMYKSCDAPELSGSSFGVSTWRGGGTRLGRGCRSANVPLLIQDGMLSATCKFFSVTRLSPVNQSMAVGQLHYGRPPVTTYQLGPE
ncbi:hypothetical protein B0H15DRAFT_972925 [Mycena belliarum]|uniref:Uncharacterized protein n=1 Tax=Mycena belliarum TaxID=1033014 RepID=A0AAD6TP19_9AGAR|nr:hypothetical protein B0H15DRAFT_972925 [Mycena belliae]